MGGVAYAPRLKYMKEPIFIPPTEQPGDDTIRANVKQLFTVQERLAMSDLIQKGKIDFVGAALDVENPERAYWLDQYLIMKRPKNEPEDSIVQEELRNWQGQGNDIDTPEKAAFWNARMDQEKNGAKLVPLEEALVAITPVVQPESDIVESASTEAPAEAPVEAVEATEAEATEEKEFGGSMSKTDLKVALDAKGIKYSSLAKKAELQALLDA